MRTLLACLLLLCAAVAHATDTGIGIVSIHGKWGRPPGPLAGYLERSGYRVRSPEMPWSGGRNYDADYESAMEQLHQEVLRLRNDGARKVVLIGHSFGANGAIAYLTRFQDADALVLLAPGQVVEGMYRGGKTRAAVDQARQMVADSKGDERLTFIDPNSGDRSRAMSAQTRVFLSYFDPAGLANMPKSASRIPVSVPVLCVMSADDRIFRLGPRYVFDKFKPNDKSVYVETQASHIATPEASTEDVLRFLRSLD